jgi:hypothetical protein
MTTTEENRDNSAIQLSSLSNNVNLVAISLAIFTFLLFFFNGSASSGQIHSVLFQVTLGLIVAAVFSFGVAGLYNFVLIFSTPAKHIKVQSHRRRSEVFFALGLSILLLEPSLILFTVGFAVIASVALILFLAYMTIYLYESRTIHAIRRN